MVSIDPPLNETLAALADYICAFRERVTDEWIKAVRQDSKIPTADRLSLQQLTDHLPALFDDLTVRLRTHNAAGATPRETENARTHGHDRWQQDYHVTELLRETAIIRQIILLSTLPDFAQQHAEFRRDARTVAKRIIHEFFNHLIGSSVAQYVDDQNAAFRRANENLAALNARLERTNQELQRVDRSRLLMTRNVSHEVRNIANAIGSAVEVLALRGGDAEYDEMISVCRRSLGDMQQLLHQLLDYSTLLAHGEQIEIESRSMRELCEEIAATFRPVAQQHGLTFDADCSADLPISSDPRKLKQIAANLILNAIKYSKPERGGRVQFSCQPANGHHWKMSVADTGIGISAKDLEVIFDEFQRGSAAQNTQGTGLGLTITKRLTELLGGRVEATSAPGEGSRFDVILPRTGPSSPTRN